MKDSIDGWSIDIIWSIIILTCMQKQGEQCLSESLKQSFSYFLCQCGKEFEYSKPFSQHAIHCPTHADTLRPYIYPHTISILQHIAPLASILTSLKQNRPSSPKKPLPCLKKAKTYEAPIVWKGFFLSRNQDYCEPAPFYCGNCQIIFFNASNFVIHCIEDCQNIHHQRSSHFITHQADYPQPEPIEHQRLNEDDYKPFRGMLRHKTDHRGTVPIYCGECQQQFSDSSAYSFHMNKQHNGVISVGSSHILLKFMRRDKKMNIYLSPNLPWPVKEPIYCCPCSLHTKLTMPELIDHIQKVHHGLSPIYRVPERAKKLGTMQKIREILDERLDHRQDPFFCGSCHIWFNSTKGYTKHMKMSHHSHVVLRVTKNIKVINIYLRKKREMGGERDYFCPCQPWRKMMMGELIDHVQSSHTGFSPLYSINNPQATHNGPIALSSDSDSDNTSQE